MADIVGTEQDDVLVGTPGDDVVRAGGGNDSVDPGLGHDVVYGGAGQDQLRLYDSGSLYGEDGNDQLTGDKVNRGALYGGLGNDLLRLFDSSDSSPLDLLLDGGGGDDTFRYDVGYRASGSLRIAAGDGDDRVFAGATEAAVAISLGAGSDRVDLMINGTAGDRPLTISDFAAGDGGDVIELSTYLAYYAGDWDQRLNPFSTGHLFLVQQGADTIVRIRPYMLGAFDSAVILTLSNVTAASLTALNFNGIGPDGSWGNGVVRVGGSDSYEVEGTSADDQLTSSMLGSRLLGYAGRDVLTGGPGQDTIDGGAGDDIISGGSGNDDIRSGGGSDVVSGGDGDDLIFAWSHSSIAETSTISGDAGDDRIVAWGIRDTFVIDGGAGRDYIGLANQNSYQLTLGAGADVIDLGEYGRFIGSVVVTDFQAGADGDRIEWTNYLRHIEGWDPTQNPFAIGKARLVASGADTLVQIKHEADQGAFATVLSLAGVAPSALVAVNLDGYDPLYVSGAPGSAVVVRQGGTGPDRLEGGDSDDRLDGGGGDDLLIGREGADRLTGGSGIDTADYSDSLFGVSVRLDGTAASGGDAAGDRLDGIERLRGSASGDALVGDAAANRLEGLGGADILDGSGGDDLLEGGSGDDRLDGGTGIDQAVVAAAYTQSVMEITASGEVKVTSADGVDLMRNIEAIQFNDRVLSTSTLTAIDGVYLRDAARHANAQEMSYWLRQLDAGRGLADVRVAVLFSQPGSSPVNGESLISVAIDGAGIRLTNAPGGRISGSVTLDPGGSTLINQAGGVIQPASGLYYDMSVVIQGFDGVDRIENSGAITGTVRLGGGNDVYVTRVINNSVQTIVDMGSGNDVFMVRGTEGLAGTVTIAPRVIGGAGVDRFVTVENAGSFGGEQVTGFEVLELGVNGYAESFSRLERIEVNAAAEGRLYNALRFFDTPAADVTISIGGTTTSTSLRIYDRSSVRSITGSAVADHLSLGSDTVISGAVTLGAGDDTVTIWSSQFSNPAQTQLASTIAGGTGRDWLSIQIGGGSIDLGNVVEFEEVSIWSVTPGTTTVSHADRFAELVVGGFQDVVLRSSDLSGDMVRLEGSSQLTIEADTVVGRLAYALNVSEATVPGNPMDALRLINGGRIETSAKLSAAADLYDGRSGASDGTVHGYAGDDTMLGGVGVDRFEGGFGADRLEGNGGNDVLLGDAGDDILSGGAGVDRLTGGMGADVFRDTASGLNGDAITDFARGDTLHFTDRALAGFAFSLSGETLTYTGGTLTLAGVPANTLLRAAASAAGGVELTLGSRVENDFNGDGRSDVLWRHGNGMLTNWLSTGNGFAGAATVTVDPSWRTVGAGDFNGDGRADLLWRHASGMVTNWFSTGSGFAGGATVTVDNSWRIAGTGDFNGDGRSDILWRHSSGMVTNWFSTDNGFVGGPTTTAVSTDWRIAGTGDFNGDGRADILWRHASGMVTSWQSTGSGFVGSATTVAVGSDWRIAGTGDFSGDGRSDILWRNDNGTVTHWQSTGDGFAGSAAAATVGPEWTIAGTGDFNGDGRADVLWRNAGGTVTDWLSTGNGFVGNDAANQAAALDWAVQNTNTDFLI